MKHFYTFLLLGLLAATPCGALAQTGKTTGKVYVGYAKYDDSIWEYDGLSLNHNAQVGCAILLTREMLAPYVGGTITGMRVGWDTSTQTGTYQGFVRETFNGENLTTGKATVRYSYNDANPGWNDMKLSHYEIPEDVQQLVVGFTTRLSKDVCAIPMLYPHGVARSCYLWVEGDVDENGDPAWTDMSSGGILPILLTIQDTQGNFNYLPVITSLLAGGVDRTETPVDGLISIRNAGSQAIRSLEITSRQGEQAYSQKVTLSKNIAVGASSSSFLFPVYCFHTGDVELSITKVNDTEIPNSEVRTVSFIGIPDEVAEQYKHRPLVEYYESENNYRSARYYDEYVAPSLRDKLARLTFVCQHLDDQFMTGDDDATVLSLQLCGGDSSAVSIPAMTIDRAMSTDNISFQINTTYNPMFPVLIDNPGQPYASQALNAAMTHPTFVGVEVSGSVQEDGETVSVAVNADIAPGVMPADESLRLTVYLMEREVESDSQLFWTEKEKEETKGYYVHANVIREILTDAEGDVLDSDGKFTVNYTTQLDPMYNTDNLYLVAFIHRDGSRGYKAMHVLNSAEGEIQMGDGIHGIASADSSRSAMYDLSGRRVESGKLPKGIYLVGGRKVAIQ